MSDIHHLETNLDLKQNLNVYANCKQLDILHLVFNVFDDGVQADLSNYNVRLKAMKSDNVPLIQDTQYTLINNLVTIIAHEQLTTTSGITKIELQFINKTTGEKKATFNLNLKVIASTLEIDRSISTATYTLLEELENKLDQALDFFENIDEAVEVNTTLVATTNNASTTNNTLNTTISTGNTLKTNLSTVNNTASTNITNLTTQNNNATSNTTTLTTKNGEAITNITNLTTQNTNATSNISTLTTKNSDAVTNKSNLDSSISTANTTKTALDLSNTTANTTKTDLNTSNTTALATKSALDTSNTNATTTKIALDASDTTANTTKTNLDSSNTTANTTKTNLDTSNANATAIKSALDALITNANTTKSELTTINTTATTTENDLTTINSTASTTKTNLTTENVRAEANITAMQGFGDVTELTQNVTNLKTEIENARNGEINLDTRLDKVTTQLSDLTNVAITAPTVAYGMNNVIKNDGKVSAKPRFTMIGKTVINLLGKDGNCENVSKWADYLCSHILDSTNKMFGNNGIKVTLTSTGGAILKYINVDIAKYYCVSAYIKNGNATNGAIQVMTDNGGSFASPVVADTTKFNRVFIKFSASTLNVGSPKINLTAVGTSGQYVYYDGVMLEEITQAQYNDVNFVPSPYVDSYSCLTNPYIEIRHDNLVINGNCEDGIGWWTPNTTNVTLSIVNGKFQLVAIGAGSVVQTVNVKPNTNYYLSGNVNGTVDNKFTVVRADGTTNLLTGTGSFNTGDNTSVIIRMSSYSASTATFDSIMLIEGTTAPTSYLPCRLERTVIEGNFTSDDSLVYENGEVSGLKYWKHKTLFGKDCDWQFSADYTGFKRVILSNSYIPNFVLPITIGTATYIKYDGKILTEGATTASNGDVTSLNNDTNLYLNSFDTDTGWAEAIAPNNDEVKAFMNGWKAIGASGGNRYIAWISIIDGSIPSGAASTTVATTYTGGTTLYVTDGTKFAVNDFLAMKLDSGAYVFPTVNAITGNTITLSVAVGSASVGNIVMKADNGTTNVSLLNWCKNNTAPGYEGYRLHYKLQNPEPITDVNTSISGDIPKFDVGDNYLFLDNGIVLGEVANPTTDYAGSYVINELINGISKNNNLKSKAESFLNIAKNGIYDFSKWSMYYNSPRTNGNVMYYTPTTNFDQSATYTVDYKILATQAPQIGTIACSYTQDIVSAINKLEEEVGSRQAKDSALDTLVDLSLYERVTSTSRSYFKTSTTGYVDFIIPITPKKTKPIVTLISTYIGINNIECSSKFTFNVLSIFDNSVRISFSTTDATTISNLFTYGFDGAIKIIADCNKKI